MSAGGLVVRKKEMTKLWVDGAYMSATMLELVPQELVRYKSEEKDGYVAAVVGVEKKELKEKEKGIKTKYTKVIEFSVDDNFAGTYNQ